MLYISILHPTGFKSKNAVWKTMRIFRNTKMKQQDLLLSERFNAAEYCNLHLILKGHSLILVIDFCILKDAYEVVEFLR